MKKRLITILLAATMAISACTPKQTDAPVTQEEIDQAESMDEVGDAEDESAPETENALKTENISEEDSGIEEESVAEEENTAKVETFTEKSTDQVSFLLNIAGLRPEEVWSLDENKVYFGQFEGHPIAYRVLPVSTDTQTIDSGEDCLLLDCDAVLLTKEYDADGKKNDGQIHRQNEWKGSDLEAWLNGNDFLENSSVFSDVERAAVATTSLAECRQAYSAGRWTYEDFGATDRVFLLSAAEAKQLYVDDAARAKTGSNPSWWIRSAFAEAGQGAGAVHEDGHICNNSVNNFSNGICPAFNVSLSSILFVSAIRTDENSTSGEWKMTLLDESKTVQITDGQTVARTDSEADTVITVPYTCAGSDITQISVMITDQAYADDGAQILFYGALQEVEINNTTGTGIFTLPPDLKNQTCGRDYYVYLIAEAVNGDQRTDYAGEPYAITVPKAE